MIDMSDISGMNDILGEIIDSAAQLPIEGQNLILGLAKGMAYVHSQMGNNELEISSRETFDRFV